MKIDNNAVRRQLKREREQLRKNRKRDFDDNRARFSAATEDSVSRVLMLEDLLNEEEPADAIRS